jgi:hypothetical protein
MDKVLDLTVHAAQPFIHRLHLLAVGGDHRPHLEIIAGLAARGG